MNPKQWLGVVVGILIVGGLVWTLAMPKPATDSANKSQTPAATQPAPAATGAASSDAGTTAAVMINSFAFAPASLTVKKGTTVTWTNQDDVGHSVTLDSGQPAGGPTGPLLGKGDRYSFTFKTAGTYHYHCSIHPSMKGSVTVTD
jgi:amicyanin